MEFRAQGLGIQGLAFYGLGASCVQHGLGKWAPYMSPQEHKNLFCVGNGGMDGRMNMSASKNTDCRATYKCLTRPYPNWLSL